MKNYDFDEVVKKVKKPGNKLKKFAGARPNGSNNTKFPIGVAKKGNRSAAID